MTLILFLYAESNERLQVHLKERMHSLEEKNHLSNELERTKKKLEESTENKARTDAQLERLKNELNFKMVQKDAHEESLIRYLFLTSHFSYSYFAG